MLQHSTGRLVKPFPWHFSPWILSADRQTNVLCLSVIPDSTIIHTLHSFPTQRHLCTWPDRPLQIAVINQLKIVCPGYQRELTYQRQDGAFSTFGNNDNSGSTWYAFLESLFIFYLFLKIYFNVVRQCKHHTQFQTLTVDLFWWTKKFNFN